jgi:hypothetical protein
MLVLFLTLFVSAAELQAAHGVSCVGRGPGQGADAASALAVDRLDHREDQAAGRRLHAPPALPAARFAFPPPLPACAFYAPPALGPRQQTATPSSQRDPPDSLA